MRGTSGSVFKNVLLNPLVWIGLALTGFTLHYEGKEHAFELFYKPETYRNLSIGAALYVALFNRQYKKGGERLDYGETLMTVLETMYVILLVWGVSLFAVVNYHVGGENYSKALAERYRKNGWIKNGDAAEDAAAARETAAGILESGEVDFEKGKRYKITPQADGSMVIEVLE